MKHATSLAMLWLIFTVSLLCLAKAVELWRRK